MTTEEPLDAHRDPRPVAGSWCADAVPSSAQWTDVIEELHRWSAEALTSGPLPPFGSAAWCALPDDRARVHAAIRAAVAWWTEQWASADADARDRIQASHAVSAAMDWARAYSDLRADLGHRIPRQR